MREGPSETDETARSTAKKGAVRFSMSRSIPERGSGRYGDFISFPNPDDILTFSGPGTVRRHNRGEGGDKVLVIPHPPPRDIDQTVLQCSSLAENQYRRESATTASSSAPTERRVIAVVRGTREPGERVVFQGQPAHPGAGNYRSASVWASSQVGLTKAHPTMINPVLYSRPAV